MERATRLARGTAVPRHAQRATNAPPGRFLASLAPCSTLCPLEPKNKGMTNVMPLFFGAGDEARTRYLHLGKVALYQMSYGRILETLLGFLTGASDRNRTNDTGIFSPLLYRLSYRGAPDDDYYT